MYINTRVCIYMYITVLGGSLLTGRLYFGVMSRGSTTMLGESLENRMKILFFGSISLENLYHFA